MSGERVFHSKDGWYFERQNDGSVRVLVKTWDDAAVLEDVTLDPHTWASVVASMSAEGENGATWRAALDRQISTASVSVPTRQDSEK